MIKSTKRAFALLRAYISRWRTSRTEYYKRYKDGQVIMGNNMVGWKFGRNGQLFECLGGIPYKTVEEAEASLSSAMYAFDSSPELSHERKTRRLMKFMAREREVYRKLYQTKRKEEK